MFAILLTLCLFASAFAAQDMQQTERIWNWMTTLMATAFQQALGFSLVELWDTVVAIGGALYDHFVTVMLQLLFAGTAIWNQVTPIFTQLMYDIVHHVSEASVYIEQALAQVQMILLTGGKRSVDILKIYESYINFLVQNLGLEPIWDIIVGLGTSVYLQFVLTITQIYGNGIDTVNMTLPIFQQLTVDVLADPDNALDLVVECLGVIHGILAG